MSQQMAAMSLGGSGGGAGDMLTSPTTHNSQPVTGYVVNQNAPQQVYQPQVAGGEHGDLLL